MRLSATIAASSVVVRRKTTTISRTLSVQGGKKNNDIINGQSSTVNSSSQSSDIVESAAATTHWKRSHYQNIENKFHKTKADDDAPTNELSTTTNRKQQEPLNITNDDDVQPMWKEMESRVTKRRSLTLQQLQQRGGVSGRRNMRKSDEDVWLEAGVYNTSDDTDDESGDKDDDDKDKKR